MTFLAGKGDIRVCDVLRHECGLVTLDKTVGFTDVLPSELRQRDAVAAIIQNQKPSWPKNTKREYHGVTRGWILNEIFRRLDPNGRTMGDYS